MTARVTELPSPHTRKIDAVSLKEALAQIFAADLEIFGSREWGLGLLCPGFQGDLQRLRNRLKSTLAGQGRIVVSGAGTSGRIALQMAARYSRVHGRNRVTGLMAGGPAAVFKAREGAEDDPLLGASDLIPQIPENGPWAYIGITCGLSAAYVAGQVETALSRGAAAVAVIGFNRMEHASGRRLAPWDRSFRDCLRDLEQRPEGFLLNPIVGPEPIAGSTRMKGGTATMIVLSSLLGAEEPKPFLDELQNISVQSSRQAKQWLPWIEEGCRALAAGGHIRYLADAGLAMTALIDAAECPPTFGAHPNQVRAFVDASFTHWIEGLDCSGHLLPDFDGGRSEDGLFLLARGNSGGPLGGWRRELERTARRFFQIDPESIMPKPAVRPDSPSFEDVRDIYLKRLLNALTTCAFIQAGKVYGNRMIDLRISNLKLWERARRIVAELGGVDAGAAERILREVVSDRNRQSASADANNPETLVAKASRMEKTVPTAILMARRGLSAEQARERLAASPKVRDCLD